MDPNLINPERLTLLSLLVVIIYTGSKKVWVWGYQLLEADARATRWEQIALKALKVGETLADKKDPDVL